MTDFDTIERRLIMRADPERIAAEIIDFHRWEEWSPWEGLDPNQSRTYSGPGSGPGATYEWSGNRKAGAGRMAISSVTPESVDIDLRFTRPFKSTNLTSFAFIPKTDGTEVVWSMRSPRTLMTRVVGLFFNMDKAIGADFDKGLAALKSRVESSGEPTPGA